MKRIQTLCLLVVFMLSFCASRRAKSVVYKCEKLTMKMCQTLGYNTTVFPNFANHRSQSEAQNAINGSKILMKLLKSNCSQDLSYLTCSYYAPVCNSYNLWVLPCRRMCKSVKKDCVRIVGKVYWPKAWNCRKLPKQTKNSICFGRARRQKTTKSKVSFD